jgi:hypothetical protein
MVLGGSMNYNLETYSIMELLSLYSKILKQLKHRKVIRSKNLVGDFGEYIAIDLYNKTPHLPRLQSAPIGTKNIDAISVKGERYSIKSTSGRVTGVFHGFKNPEGGKEDEKKFEYVIVVIFNNDFELAKILELNWDQFIQYKRWHSTVRAWNIPITKSLIENSKIVFDINNNK